MGDFNPYDVLLRPVGRLRNEKVFNASERMDAGAMEEYRKASRLEIINRRKEIRKITALSSLTAEERTLAVTRRLNAAKRLVSPEEFKKARKALEEDDSFTKADQDRMIKAESRKALAGRKADRRDQNRNQNKVYFVVRDTATKPEIKRAFEEVYSVKVVGVNTLHTRRGKRAIIKLDPKDNAEEIYTRLGQM